MEKIKYFPLSDKIKDIEYYRQLYIKYPFPPTKEEIRQEKAALKEKLKVEKHAERVRLKAAKKAALKAEKQQVEAEKKRKESEAVFSLVKISPGKRNVADKTQKDNLNQLSLF
ncbi:hypothetical protein QNI19_31880 [Cytophagaceae bacterium DM2B3-1]|uniref:Uncharacterized protein n=1 Tax=Xanthocytophaga flava TaxID=3048013 RepID=A0ABT7CV02_9BACT|nr:hypothetical protein [Xanthocytophaga flavus]MDJ1497582.1 hypothetical protein [Xanthocytophaga flavus]